MLCLLSPTPAALAGEQPAGRTVAAILSKLRDAGLEIAWSTRLVPADLLALNEPSGATLIEQAASVLAPFGLGLRDESGLMIVVRRRGPPREPVETSLSPRADPDAIETITVSASRYEIARDSTTSTYALDRQTIESMPDLGDDPIRITHRLPGAAASGASARVHLRGGEQGEVGLILNGQRLFDPFHVRDYQGVFSAIDSRALRGVEVYTGGFPVRYGDRMSGIVLMEPIDARESPRTELGLSVFNTSVLHAGSEGRHRWLGSARRGNLDLVIDPQYGQPSYYDLFAQYDVDITPDMTFTANALYAEDRVSVVLESEPEELERATSRTRNVQVWLGIENRWTERLSSRTLLSLTGYSNRRTATLDDESKMVASVRDDRDVDQVGFRQDWSFRRSDAHMLQWGFRVNVADAAYDYSGRAEYFELKAIYEGQPDSVLRELQAAPSGASYALYFADRRRLSERLVFQWGLRFDDQTYTNLSSDAQLSPRLSLYRGVGERGELRLSWGRYHQSQGIQELQIEDGVDSFWPAQRADHWILGWRQPVGANVALRVEAFHKQMQDVRPRFENLYDPLALAPELEPDRVRLTPGSARATGLELSLSGERGDWNWWASYTLSKTTDRIDGADVVRSWDQRHAVQAGLRWARDGWDFAIAGSAHTGWPATGLELESRGVDDEGEPLLVAVPGPRNAERYPSFRSLDVRLSRRFKVPRGTLMAFVEVSNLTNRRNQCCIDWDLEEGMDGGDVLERSPDYWLPLLPAVGVLWEF